MEPNHIVARNAANTRTRKICKYPDEAVYKGCGSTDDEASFACVVHNEEPADLKADSHTAKLQHEAL